MSLIKAVDLIVNHLPHSIRTLVNLDMQLIVFALTIFEDSFRDNKSVLEEIKETEKIEFKTYRY
jgi:hypothetical protein